MASYKNNFVPNCGPEFERQAMLWDDYRERGVPSLLNSDRGRNMSTEAQRKCIQVILNRVPPQERIGYYDAVILDYDAARKFISNNLPIVNDGKHPSMWNR